MMNAVVTTAHKTARRQRVIIEAHGSEFWVMFNSGDVRVFGDAEAALKSVRGAAGRGNRGITITMIEWRGCPEGWTPPS